MNIEIEVEDFDHMYENFKFFGDVSKYFTFSRRIMYNFTVTFLAFGIAKRENLKLKFGAMDFFAEGRPLAVTQNETIYFNLDKFFPRVDNIKIYTKFNKDLFESVTMGYSVNKLSRGYQYSLSDVCNPVNATAPSSCDMDIWTEQYDETGLVEANATYTYTKAGNTITEFSNFTFRVIGDCLQTCDLFDPIYRVEETPMQADLMFMPTVAGRCGMSDECSELGYEPVFEWWLYRNIGVKPNYVWEQIDMNARDAINIVLRDYIKTNGLFKIRLKISIKVRVLASKYSTMVTIILVYFNDYIILLFKIALFRRYLMK